VHELRQKGVALKATEQPIDTSNAAGKAFLDMLGVFAEFETNLRRERQLEGIAKAKAEGVYKGRKPSIDVARVKALRASGIGPAAIAKQLKMAAGRQKPALPSAVLADGDQSRPQSHDRCDPGHHLSAARPSARLAYPRGELPCRARQVDRRPSRPAARNSVGRGPDIII
jgi:hypothetical protein